MQWALNIRLLGIWPWCWYAACVKVWGRSCREMLLCKAQACVGGAGQWTEKQDWNTMVRHLSNEGNLSREPSRISWDSSMNSYLSNLILNWCNMHVGLWSDLELIQDACKSQIWSWTDATCMLVSDLILNWCKMHVELRSDLELMQDACRTQIWSWTDARCMLDFHIMGGVIMLVCWWMLDWILSWYVYFQVSRPPLFFKETNPQPRKHTLWQATSDFTGGQATTCK